VSGEYECGGGGVGHAHHSPGRRLSHAVCSRCVVSSVESLSVSGGRSASRSCVTMPRRIMGSMNAKVQRPSSELRSSATPMPCWIETCHAACVTPAGPRGACACHRQGTRRARLVPGEGRDVSG
jgi:hypothetical protein